MKKLTEQQKNWAYVSILLVLAFLTMPPMESGQTSIGALFTGVCVGLAAGVMIFRLSPAKKVAG